MKRNNVLVFSSILSAAMLVGTIFVNLQLPKVSADGDAHHENNSIFTNDILYTTNRDMVTICVEDLSSENDKDEEKLAKRIKKEIDLINKKDERYRKAGYEKFDMDVKVGCSFSPYLLEEDVTHPFYSSFDGIRLVDTPSPEQLAIFVVDEAVVDKNYKNAYSRWSPEQFVCEGHECNGVTRALYFSPKEAKEFVKELSKNELFYKELLHGLSLESVAPPVDLEKQEEARAKKKKEVEEMKAKQ